MKLIVFLLPLCFINYNCSNDEKSSSKEPCNQGENRKIIQTFKNIGGTIKGPNEKLCDNVFVIETNEKLEGVTTGLLFPCNLSGELKINGTKIIFSGNLFETFDFEDICANKFEITDFNLNN